MGQIATGDAGLTVLVVILGVALCVLIVAQAFIVSSISKRLAELVPPEFAATLAGLAEQAIIAGKADIARRALEAADKTAPEWDNDLARAIVSQQYDIEVTPDGGYILTPRDEAAD